MTVYALNQQAILSDENRFRKYYLGRISVVGFAGISLALAIIYFFNQMVPRQMIYDVYGSAAFKAVTITPYLLATVVIAITVVAIISLIPLLKSRQQVQMLADRLHQLGEGDLVSKTKVTQANGMMKEIARELGFSIGELNHSMAQLKIINRQQWNYLQEIRHLASIGDCARAAILISKMEDNWVKIAEIEDRYQT